MAGIGEKVEAVELGGILALLGLIGYGGYKLYSWLEKNYGPGTPDPGGGAPAKTLIGGIANAIVEIGKSSLSYEGAFEQSALSPLETIKTIVGLNQGEASTADAQQEISSQSGIFIAP